MMRKPRREMSAEERRLDNLHKKNKMRKRQGLAILTETDDQDHEPSTESSHRLPLFADEAVQPVKPGVKNLPQPLPPGAIQLNSTAHGQPNLKKLKGNDAKSFQFPPEPPVLKQTGSSTDDVSNDETVETDEHAQLANDSEKPRFFKARADMTPEERAQDNRIGKLRKKGILSPGAANSMAILATDDPAAIRAPLPSKSRGAEGGACSGERIFKPRPEMTPEEKIADNQFRKLRRKQSLLNASSKEALGSTPVGTPGDAGTKNYKARIDMTAEERSADNKFNKIRKRQRDEGSMQMGGSNRFMAFRPPPTFMAAARAFAAMHAATASSVPFVPVPIIRPRIRPRIRPPSKAAENAAVQKPSGPKPSSKIKGGHGFLNRWSPQQVKVKMPKQW